MWQYIDRKTIAHTDGHRIELRSGNWYEPEEVLPKFMEDTSAVTSAKLIREGLAFAESNHYVKTSVSVTKPSKPKSNRAILSLKK